MGTRQVSPEHKCEDCGEFLVLKNSKRGNQFWGCTNWSKNHNNKKCLIGIDVLPDGEENDSKGEHKQTKTSELSQSRVDWSDASLRRNGWKAKYVALGASMRSVTMSSAPSRRTAWIAWSDLSSFEPADADTRRVLGMFLKLLGRGDSPPIHPKSERQLLSLLGYESLIKKSPLPGDISPFIYPKISISSDAFSPPVSEDSMLEDLTESNNETLFVRWFQEMWPAHARWLTSQPSFDMLLKTHGIVAESCRRCDFILSIPGVESVVIEIDGVQHDAQALVDDERDEKIQKCGISTIRIPASEIQGGHGAGIDAVNEVVSEAPIPDSSFELLVWAPQQLHRLAQALVQACSAGFIAGQTWTIEVFDSTQVAVEVIGPYLEMLNSLDILWGTGEIAPQEVNFKNGNEWVQFVRQDGAYMPIVGLPKDLDVAIRLEFDETPFCEMPARTTIPTVVVRSSNLPIFVSNPPIESNRRISVKSKSVDTRQALQRLLQAIFAKEDFREGQYEALLEILEGRDCTVLLPTGAGKSIIYQLAGLCLPGRTIVIDPLVALIEDQVEGLRGHGIDRVIGISSATTKRGLTKSLLAAVANADAYFIFIAPERMKIQAFRSALREMTSQSPVNLAVIDEAHCVSEWGHDFRTSYLGLGATIRDHCKDSAGVPPPLLALTGTASRAVLKDVLYQLEMEERTANSIVRPKSFDRPELKYQVIHTTPTNDQSDLRGVLKSLPSRFGESPQTFYETNGRSTFSGLIFCPTASGYHSVVATSEAIESVISNNRIYAGGKPRQIGTSNWDDYKRRNAEAFKNDHVLALVSTNAFGMGIDKQNIRWVIHYGLPKSIESYYQEVGRAGRDRHEAECILILTEFDAVRNENLLSEQINLSDLRQQHVKVGGTEKDDVIQSLWFHLQNFSGIDEEHLTLLDVVERLGPTESRRRLALPFGTEQKSREKALHRLMLLGVVSDYLVEFGPQEFMVILNGIAPNQIVDNVLKFIERSQPGRAEAVRSRVEHDYQKVSEAIDVCGRVLMEFIYDTIERSRRRSIREMWLTAKAGQSDEILRRRVLDYLAEGDIFPEIEKLVVDPVFSFKKWQSLWSTITNINEAREWRGSTARLLASYPTHPGLLVGRGLAEVIDVKGDLRDFEFNLESALRSARESYGSSTDDIEDFADWLLKLLTTKNKKAICALVGVMENIGQTTGEIERYIESNWDSGDTCLAIVGLSKKLQAAVRLASEIEELVN